MVRDIRRAGETRPDITAHPAPIRISPTTVLLSGRGDALAWKKAVSSLTFAPGCGGPGTAFPLLLYLYFSAAALLFGAKLNGR